MCVRGMRAPAPVRSPNVRYSSATLRQKKLTSCAFVCLRYACTCTCEKPERKVQQRHAAAEEADEVADAHEQRADAHDDATPDTSRQRPDQHTCARETFQL